MVKYDAAAAQNIEQSYKTPDIRLQRERTLQALQLKPAEQVLDIGCGTGFLVQEMAQQVGDQGRVTGVDKSEAMLQVARQRCANAHNIELSQCDAEQLPVPDASLDAITCTQLLLYVQDAALVLQAMQRALKPGGRVAIIETDWRGAILHSHSEMLTRQMFDAWDAAVSSPNLPARLNKLLQSNGFEAVQILAIPIINTEINDEAFSATVLGWLHKQAISQKVVSQAVADAWLADLHALSAKGEYFFNVNRFLFTAVKS